LVEDFTMIRDDRDKKRFGPKPFSSAEPTSEWDVEQSGTYLHWQHQFIVDGEKSLTPCYWRLGYSLELARHQFTYGQWEKYLAHWGINKVRAARARAIRRTFSTLKEVERLTVEEAFERRQRRQPATARGKTESQHGPMGAFMAEMGPWCRRAEALVDEAAFAERAQAALFLPPLGELIHRLERLQAWLRQQATGS
jgi:hypothetical protein